MGTVDTHKHTQMSRGLHGARQARHWRVRGD